MHLVENSYISLDYRKQRVRLYTTTQTSFTWIGVEPFGWTVYYAGECVSFSNALTREIPPAVRLPSRFQANPTPRAHTNHFQFQSEIYPVCPIHYSPLWIAVARGRWQINLLCQCNMLPSLAPKKDCSAGDPISWQRARERQPRGELGHISLAKAAFVTGSQLRPPSPGKICPRRNGSWIRFSTLVMTCWVVIRWKEILLQISK